LRIKAFWGGQLCCLQIGLLGSYYLKVNFRIWKNNAFEHKLTPPNVLFFKQWVIKSFCFFIWRWYSNTCRLL